VDWDNDGKKDLLSGDTKGQIWLYLNTGTQEAPELAEGTRVEADGKPIVGIRRKMGILSNGKRGLLTDPKAMIGIYSKIHFGDWNGDGLGDLLVGQTGPGGHDVLFYRNVGTEDEPKFGKPEPLKLPGAAMSRPSPYLVDWDLDGRVDIVCGTERPPLYFFRNVGTDRNPQLEPGKEINLVGDEFVKGYRCRIDVTDWNNDGKHDLLVGNFYSYKKPRGGNIWLFLGK